MKKNISITGNQKIPEGCIEDFKKIGLAIHELRFHHGLLTQKELAEECGVHFNTIRSIEQGHRNYNLLSLLKIIQCFDYDLTDFIEELF